MNSKEPMDRLVSGDVGFGKTEVAIRAMFKAFLSNKVSVLLCPTTILADQHFITAKSACSIWRFISLLSRFKTKKEQLKTLSRLNGPSRHFNRNTSAVVQRCPNIKPWFIGY